MKGSWMMPEMDQSLAGTFRRLAGGELRHQTT